MADRARLWPEPGQMHSYLDRWTAYVQEADERLEQEVKLREQDNANAAHQIQELRQELDTVAAPLEAMIAGLNQELVHARNQIAALERIQRENLERLATVLEINPNARGTTLTSVVSNTVIVVEESKKMIQEHL